MVAERVVALPAGDEGTKDLICNRILDALLPLSLTPDPALQIPGESLSHGEHSSRLLLLTKLADETSAQTTRDSGSRRPRRVRVELHSCSCVSLLSY